MLPDTRISGEQKNMVHQESIRVSFLCHGIGCMADIGGMDKSREAAVEIRGKSKNMWEERLSGIQSG